MLRAIIVDDEQPAIDLLKIMLINTKEVEVIASFLSAKDALLSIEKEGPDVVFLDIEMPDTCGLELAEKILSINNNIEIVFVTAFEHYALEAFQVNALAYLMKPVADTDVKAVLARIKQVKGTQTDASTTNEYGRIFCLGEFTVYGSQSTIPVSWRTSKAEEFFAYMVQALRRKVPKQELCEALWPGYDTSKIDNQLHPTIYKTKQILSAAKIDFELTFANGAYWMDLPDSYIDIIDFNKKIEALAAINKNNIESHREIISLYKGHYLASNNYLWALAKEEEYFRRYHRVAMDLSLFYSDSNDFSSAEELLLEILDLSYLEEKTHELLLGLYYKTGNRTSFLKHYKKMAETFEEELGIKPSKAIQDLYDLIQAE